ncbi:MAG: hypothetical protein GY794_00755 [bacterium]|nr:hypothetical protein [bacterium]
MIPGGRDTAQQLAAAVQATLSYVHNPKDISPVLRDLPASILANYAVAELITSRRRPLKLSSRLPDEMAALPLFTMSVPDYAREAIDGLRQTPVVMLALLTSKLFGESTCFLYSDTFCSTGYLHFENGNINQGHDYGEEGGEALICIVDGNIDISQKTLGDGAPYDYSSPWREGARRYLNWEDGVEEFANAVDSIEEYRIFS